MKLFYGFLLSLCLSACATVNHDIASLKQEKMPVIQEFQGSLLVFSPKHRFQVLIQWQANLQQGHARLTHAASGRVVELRWQNEILSMRDNQKAGAVWQHVSVEALHDMGIVLKPWVLAQVLYHQIPKSLKTHDGETWKGKLDDSVIQLRWQNDHHRLTMTDISHGRKVVLRINP